MRDIGILVWVALLIIGVTGSMISSVRRQMQAAQGRSPARPVRRREVVLRVPPAAQSAGPSQQPAEWLQRVAQQIQAAAATTVPAAPRPQPAPKPKPPPPPAAPPVEVHAAREDRKTSGARFFANKRSLVQSVIAAEVLGKPRALNDEYTRY